MHQFIIKFEGKKSIWGRKWHIHRKWWLAIVFKYIFQSTQNYVETERWHIADMLSIRFIWMTVSRWLTWIVFDCLTNSIHGTGIWRQKNSKYKCMCARVPTHTNYKKLFTLLYRYKMQQINIVIASQNPKIICKMSLILRKVLGFLQ